MATQTTYYEFNKPEGTDLVNPLVDTNPNWDALDADLHEFNERSIANCTEVVALGVHTISRLDTTSKFLKWIATANFTAGETFTVDGLPVSATTPAGATLATNAYVTGSVVLACLNADNTAMTVFVSGTNVATDAERLGGELPSYYGTATDVSNNATDITNLQNQMGNTSIVGIGDGTATGAISSLNNDLNELKNNQTNNEIDISAFNSVNNQYLFPSDGYITIQPPSGAYSGASAKLTGSNSSSKTITSIVRNDGTGGACISCIDVKKGMKVYISAGTMLFYPLS